MGTYNASISRTDAAALIPEDYSHDIIKNAIELSAAMTYFRHRRMGRAQQRFPALGLKPSAYFVTGDTGLIQTSEVNWANKTLDAETLAVIIPVPKHVIDDADFDIWDESKPEIEEAIAVAVDQAVFFGTGAPASWPTNISTAASNAGNTVTEGTSAIDIAEDINQVMAKVEADGYDVNGFWARIQMKATLRGLRSATGELIFQPEPNNGVATATVEGTGVGTRGVSRGSIYNEKAMFSKAGLSSFADGSGNPSLIAGDWTQGIVGIRQDLEWERLKESAIFDGAGNLIYNFAQQDMVGLKVTARFAWQVPNPVNRQQPTAGSRYPFARLVQA